MINFAVIGCGNISQTYLHTLKHNRNAKVIAVADTNYVRAWKVGNEFRIQKIYNNYIDLLDLKDLDAVVVCTPHHLHCKQVLDCAERNIDVLCEKPLATTLRNTRKMIHRCKHIKFGVMLQRRFYPNTKATKKAIESLGEIDYASLTFNCYKKPGFYKTWRGKKISGGGVLLSQALHRIDRLVYFFGEYKAINGISKTTRNYIDVEDYVDATLEFKNGVTASIEANNSKLGAKTESIIKIEGKKGQITLSDDKTPRWNVNGIPKPPEADNPIPIKYRPLYYGPCHEMVINDFVNAIKNDRQPKITAEDSLEAMKIIFDFYNGAKND